MIWVRVGVRMRVRNWDEDLGLVHLRLFRVLHCIRVRVRVKVRD
jgi:hypothetical protein